MLSKYQGTKPLTPYRGLGRQEIQRSKQLKVPLTSSRLIEVNNFPVMQLQVEPLQ